MSTFRDRTCLITGADGFLGAHLAKALIEQGASVVGAVLNRKGESSLTALGAEQATKLEYGDITDYGFVERLVNAYEPDYMFHLAAVSAVRVAQACPGRAFRTNVVGTLNLLESCRQTTRRPQGIVVASSDKAFGSAEPPYWDDLRLEPKATYEASKAAVEQVCRAYFYEHRLPVAVTRCANLYGAADLNWSRVIPGSIKRALRGEAPIVYQESANSYREFLHVDDAVNAYLLLARYASEIEEFGHNVGGERASILDVAQQISRATNGPAPVLIPRPGAFQEIPDQYMVSSRMEALGWRRQTSLDEGLARTVEWYRRYFGGALPLQVGPARAHSY